MILHGAKGLAIPSKLGQSLKVKESNGSDIVWKSYRKNGEMWFDAKFDLLGIEVVKTSDEAIANRLRKIIRAAIRNNSDFLSKWKKYTIETFMEFEPEWGLGSSSTLIHNIASWAEANPFHVYFGAEDGSGYDIACAGADGPLFYQLKDEEISYTTIDFNPSFKKYLYFIYSGTKQSSAEEVKAFNKRKDFSQDDINAISKISEDMVSASSLNVFEKLVEQHEEIMSKCLDRPKVKDDRFSDFWGSVKSLGAWGGDFVMVTSKESPEKTKAYFNQKGLDVCFTFDELLLS